MRAVLWFDAQVQRGVDAAAHEIMRRFGVARWFLRYGIAVYMVFSSIFYGVLVGHWGFQTFLALVWFGDAELRRRAGESVDRADAMDGFVVGLPGPFRALFWGLSLCTLVGAIAAPTADHWLTLANNVLLTMDAYLSNTPPSPPPKKKREHEAALQPLEAM